MDDSLSARVTSGCPEDIRLILYTAWGHDLGGLKQLLDDRDKASVQDPKTGETPLHAAVRACGPSEEDEERDAGGNGDVGVVEEDGSIEEAKQVMHELFMSGAIWNDVDDNDETPGCVAWRLGRTSLYNVCVEAGVRAEMLFALMGGYEELSSGGSAEDEQEEEQGHPQTTSTQLSAAKDPSPEAHNGIEPGQKPQASLVPKGVDPDIVTSLQYLQSDLTYDSEKLVDADLNGVMMSWETDIMRRSVSCLLPDSPPGKRILNIGFGMGIIDAMFADSKPSRHHIIEAHPAVLRYVSEPSSKFGKTWEDSGPTDGAFKVLAGRWQDVVPKLLEQGEVYDAIYFDTFGEDYSQLRMFVTEYIPGLLDSEGRFSFFNGLGADRRICYDVYAKVVEMHCADAGLDLDWEEIDVDMSALGEEGKGQWEGVRRRYWTLDSRFIASRVLPSGADFSQDTGCPFALSWDRPGRQARRHGE